MDFNCIVGEVVCLFLVVSHKISVWPNGSPSWNKDIKMQELRGCLEKSSHFEKIIFGVKNLGQ